MQKLSDYSAMGRDIAARGVRLASSFQALSDEAQTLLADSRSLADALNKADIHCRDKTELIAELDAFGSAIKMMFLGKA